ncbi:hypothetical protein ACNRWW_14265 [Metabacillus sp. HB246100]
MNRETNLTILLIVFILFISFNSINIKTDTVESMLNLFATIGSAIIGGYVAFYSSYMQVKGNKKLERYKELKLERNICILVKNDLKDINQRLYSILENSSHREYTYGELKPYINIDSLEKFKTEYIHILNYESEVLAFSSVLNRLNILKNSSDEKKLNLSKFEKLIEDINKIITLISQNSLTINNEIIANNKKT